MEIYGIKITPEDFKWIHRIIMKITNNILERPAMRILDKIFEMKIEELEKKRFKTKEFSLMIYDRLNGKFFYPNKNPKVKFNLPPRDGFNFREFYSHLPRRFDLKAPKCIKCNILIEERSQKDTDNPELYCFGCDTIIAKDVYLSSFESRATTIFIAEMENILGLENERPSQKNR